MVVFVIAMESEAAPLLEKMVVKKKYFACGRQVLCGKLAGKKTAALICGVGKVNAAASTQYAIDKLGADKVVNIGVAGGLSDDMKIGAVYSVGAAVQYDFDLTEINGTPMGTLNEYTEPYIKLDTCGGFEIKNLGSGDRFNDDRADFKLLTKTLGAHLRDMEGGAIVHVCKRAGIKCYSFKAVSDLAGKGSTPEQYKRNLDECAKALCENIESIFTEVYND